MFEENFRERKKRVLYAVIHSYILTAVPVGSKIITEKYGIELSPATVRNILSELEEMGYLNQPHTSAGRVPTDKGLRFYVDSLIKLRGLKKTEKEEIKHRYDTCLTETKDIMEETSRILSLLSSYVGVVLAPKFPSKIIKKIEFIRLGPRQILVVIISASGIIHSKSVAIEEEIYQHDLDRMSQYLNKIASNLTLAQIKKKVYEELCKDKILFDKFLTKALEIGQIAMKEAGDKGDVYIEGKINILDQPEFSDIEMMKGFFKAFEEKSTLIKILDKSLETEGVRILIGSESEYSEIQDYSIIAAPYKISGDAMGTVGIIGPKRMNYSRVIPIVDYTADIVGKLLEKRCGLS
jgi:heat-inducible transcriptional repressor